MNVTDLYPFLAVRDVARAVEFYSQAFGAVEGERFPVRDQPYGLRQGRIIDPFGHHWLISGEARG